MANNSVIAVPRQARRGSLLLIVGAVLAVLVIVATLIAVRHVGQAEGPYVRALADRGIMAHPVPGQMRSGLDIDIAVGLLAAIVTGALSVLSRRPIALFKAVLRVATVVIYLAVGFALSTGTDIESSAGSVADDIDRMEAALVPSWYASVNTILMAGIAMAMTAAVIALSGEVARDFYLSGSKADDEDPRWGAILQQRSGS